MDLTPRKDFRESPHANGWADLCASPQFEAAAKAAMLQMQADLLPVNPRDAATMSSIASELVGAKIFLNYLMSLTESTQQPKPTTTGINYRA